MRVDPAPKGIGKIRSAEHVAPPRIRVTHPRQQQSALDQRASLSELL
jgi:hypothetical protein